MYLPNETKEPNIDDNHETFRKMHAKLRELQENALRTKLISREEMFEALRVSCSNGLPADTMIPIRKSSNEYSFKVLIISVIFVFTLLVVTPITKNAIEYILGIRCFVPNNYLIWEATRPVSDCRFCTGITKPVILHNMTQAEFAVSLWNAFSIIIVIQLQLNYPIPLSEIRLFTTTDNHQECHFTLASQKNPIVQLFKEIIQQISTSVG